MIRVLFFARLRESLGTDRVELDYAPELASVEAVREQLVIDHPAWRETLCAPNVITALNQEVVDPGAAVADGDELAFYPPVTGG